MSDHNQNSFFYTFNFAKCLLGVLTFVANVIIFVTFASKNKKSTSDYLVIPHLVVGSLYGIVICIPIDFQGKVDGKISGRVAFVSQQLIFCSIILLLIMTINRYVAVLNPSRYNIWFSKQFLSVMFIVIAFLYIISLTTLLYFLYIGKKLKKSVREKCKEYGIFEFDYENMWHQTDSLSLCRDKTKTYEVSFMNEKFVSFHLWPQLQLLLVICYIIIMSFVYKRIGKNLQPDLNAGFLNQFVINCFTGRREKAIDGADLSIRETIFLSDQEMNRKIGHLDQTNANISMSMSTQHRPETLISTSGDVGSLATLSVSSDVSRYSFEDPDLEHSQFYMNKSKRGRTANDETGGQNDQQKRSVQSSRKQTPKVHKTLTLTFFYVGLVFIIVALPTSLFNAAGLWYLLITDQVSEVFTIGFWVSQTFYGFVYLINPCLYASSNSDVKEKVRTVARQVCKRCSFCKQHDSNA
ncbi:uncharacterized protein LOC142353655 isoform X2 [Convolutriloba macropyga]|uniref:uncharacterized protein LOC142353655 isoform X2 n=1 Tax=Convolutriloba macropyga TaxID=536237 RepID=UPI003F520405